eukprot:TRINITY_DN757_c0_g3_i2.p1 TRINITY_DN757_c0_g3~~TRINITY_DN757_c0_g3_i2.p1  ORF type:complete len:869 (-),score=165.16 TRINITY_DN757_c0_g3_i2:67-2673(-)
MSEEESNHLSREGTSHEPQHTFEQISVAQNDNGDGNTGDSDGASASEDDSMSGLSCKFNPGDSFASNASGVTLSSNQTSESRHSIGLAEESMDDSSGDDDHDDGCDENDIDDSDAEDEAEVVKMMMWFAIIRFYGYEPNGRIGNGGSAMVVKASHQSTGQTVAIKCMTTEEQAHKDAARAEYDIHVGLEHANIVRMFGIIVADVCTFLIMELVCGGTLTHLITATEARLNDHLIKDVLTQLLLALEYLRSRHIVHKDIKPDNIFIDAAGTIKLGDFGIAKKVGEVGQGYTAGYSLESMAIDYVSAFSTDILAFGICLYEIVTGNRPYHKSDFAETVFYMSMEGVPIEELPAHRAGIWLTPMTKCCNEEPDCRPTVAAARAIVEALDLAGERRIELSPASSPSTDSIAMSASMPSTSPPTSAAAVPSSSTQDGLVPGSALPPVSTTSSTEGSKSTQAPELPSLLEALKLDESAPSPSTSLSGESQESVIQGPPSSIPEGVSFYIYKGMTGFVRVSHSSPRDDAVLQKIQLAHRAASTPFSGRALDGNQVSGERREPLMQEGSLPLSKEDSFYNDSVVNPYTCTHTDTQPVYPAAPQKTPPRVLSGVSSLFAEGTSETQSQTNAGVKKKAKRGDTSDEGSDGDGDGDGDEDDEDKNKEFKAYMLPYTLPPTNTDTGTNNDNSAPNIDGNNRSSVDLGGRAVTTSLAANFDCHESQASEISGDNEGNSSGCSDSDGNDRQKGERGEVVGTVEVEEEVKMREEEKKEEPSSRRSLRSKGRTTRSSVKRMKSLSRQEMKDSLENLKGISKKYKQLFVLSVSAMLDDDETVLEFDPMRERVEADMKNVKQDLRSQVRLWVITLLNHWAALRNRE